MLRKTISLLIFSLLISGCVSKALPPATDSPTIAIPGPTRTNTTTPLPVTSTSSPEIPITPTITPTPSLVTATIDYYEEIPGDLALPGVLLLQEKVMPNELPRFPEGYLLDLSTKTLIDLPMGTGGQAYIGRYSPLRISPDLQKFAYIETNTSGDQIHIVNGKGNEMSVSNWQSEDGWEIINWLDNDRLGLTPFGSKEGIVSIFDPVTGEWTTVSPSFPATNEDGEIARLDPDAQSSFVIYDPTLTRVILLRGDWTQNKWTFELWDMQSQQLLWKQRTGMFHDIPIWMDGGSYFSILFDPYLENRSVYEDFANFYSITRDGQVDTIRDQVASMPSWSPNRKWIAAWWFGERQPWDAQTPLAIVDAISKNTNLFYLQNTLGSRPADQYPLWSPDGRYIAFNEEIEDGDNNQVIIFDTYQLIAFKFISGYIVRGWLTTS